MAPPPDLRMQELLAEGDFVRSLARQLIGSAEADDLVQETWLVALRRRPVDLRAPRWWLARVLRRLAANRRRAEDRRVRRENDAAGGAPASAPSTAEILACEQVRQRVVAAVLALEEPFRGTVLARFYECLDSQAIAARERIEIATVRSRLKRGLERLRAQLDLEHGGQRAAWAAPLGLLQGKPAPLALPTGVLMGTSKKVAAVAMVCMLVGVGWWAAWPDGVEPAPVRGATHAASTTVAASEHVPDAPRATHESEGDAPLHATDAPREPMPYPVVDEPRAKLIVCVLDLATRRPIADAEVLYQPFRVDMGHESTRGDRELHEMVSSDVFLERFAHRARTGADGVAVVEVPVRGSYVLARQGDRSVSAYADPGKLVPGERLPLWLDEVRWLRFRVVDEATRAPVAGALMDVSSAGTSPVVPVSCGYGGCFGPSDHEGMICTPWPRDRTSLRVRPWTFGGGTAMQLALPKAIEGIIDVPYPATGSLTIELRTPSGNLWPTKINVYVEVDGGASWSSVGPTTWCNATPGIYRVPHLGLGLRLRVSAHPDPEANFGGKAVVLGPTRLGEDVRVVVTTPTEDCIVWADVRYADGAVPSLGLMATVLQDGVRGDAQRRGGYLEPGGRVGWTVAVGGAARGQIVLRPADGSGSDIARGAWQLSNTSPGPHELGTIVVKKPDVVVAGRVEFAPRPRPGAFVDGETLAANGNWERAYDLSAPVLADGTFEVRGITTAERVRVSLRADRVSLPSKPVVVARGARDVRLLVDSGLPLRARVLPPPAYLQAARCRAVRADGAPLPTYRERPHDDDEVAFADACVVATDGEASEFAWPALPPGIYSIEVRLPGLAAPARIIDGVRVEAGVEPDARLAAIDLRREVRMLTVVVEPLPNLGRPLTDAGVLVWPSGQQAGTRHGQLLDAAGRAQIAIGPEPVDVLVAVPGCRLWRAEAVTTSSLVAKLEACLTIPFRLAPRVAKAFAGHEVLVWVEPEYRGEQSPSVRFWRAGDREPEVQSSFGYLQRLAGDGTCTLADCGALGALPISGAGTFRLQLSVRSGTGYLPVNESWLHWQRSPLSPATVEWRAANQPPVVVDVDDKVLAKVRDELSRRR